MEMVLTKLIWFMAEVMIWSASQSISSNAATLLSVSLKADWRAAARALVVLAVHAVLWARMPL